MFEWTIGSIGGVSLVVSPLFAVLVVFLVVIMRLRFKRKSEPAPMGDILLAAGLVIPIVLLGHEGAHAAMAISLGFAVPGIVLTVWGAFTDIPDLIAGGSALALFLVVSVGPAYNLAAVLPFRWLSRSIRHQQISWVSREIARWSALLVSLMLFGRPVFVRKLANRFLNWLGVDGGPDFI